MTPVFRLGGRIITSGGITFTPAANLYLRLPFAVNGTSDVPAYQGFHIELAVGKALR